MGGYESQEHMDAEMSYQAEGEAFAGNEELERYENYRTYKGSNWGE